MPRLQYSWASELREQAAQKEIHLQALSQNANEQEALREEHPQVAVINDAYK